MRKSLITLQTEKFNHVTVIWNWFRDNLTWKDLFSSIFLSSHTKSMPLVSMAVTAEKRMKRFVSDGIRGVTTVYLVLEPAASTFLMILLLLQPFPHVKLYWTSKLYSQGHEWPHQFHTNSVPKLRLIQGNDQRVLRQKGNIPVMSRITHFNVPSLFAFIQSSSSRIHLNILQQETPSIRKA